MDRHVPFNRPFRTGLETEHIERAIAEMHLSAGGRYTQLCTDWLSERTGSQAIVLTHSCTAALEMTAMLGDIGPGDEVILPSFTFVTTAMAFVLRGATPIFVDICDDTMNIDPHSAAAAVTPATKALVAVDYAGVGCDMEALRTIADNHDLLFIEDAAQGLMASYRDRPLGSFGDLGAISFHETKNVTCGEGGALLINDPALVERAEIIRDKGTDRSRFERGAVAKYTWVDVGSSYGLSELAAAFLWGQLERADEITERRLDVWDRYHEAFFQLEQEELLRRPIVPPPRAHNAHMYYVLLKDGAQRARLIDDLAARGVNAVFHYIPLHSSPAGLRYGRAPVPLPVTDDISSRLLRLPLWAGMESDDVDLVIDAVTEALPHTPRTSNHRAEAMPQRSSPVVTKRSR